MANETEEIKSRLPIEQVVGGYVPLRKAGRIWKANCPFHGEKTPSFTVSPDRGIFKCFGCGEGGDIFDFVMKIEGLSFRETLEMLAEKAGVQLPDFKPDAKERSGPSKPRLIQVNAYAAKLWNALLTKHPSAEHAREYLHGRGLTEKSIADFQVGYSPLGQATGQALRKAGFTPEELQAAGDPTKFQDRITFPITDIVGNVVGFTGRILEHKDDPRNGKNRGPKYWNTPETPLFIKSRTLYGLHLAKRAIQEQDLAVLAEGQMDVVMMHQFGYLNTVASSGTALTQEQVKLLGRFSQNLAFCYDQDKAGIEATKRGLELVLAEGLNPFVIVVPNGKDPADALTSNPDGFKAAHEGRLPAMQWLIDQAVREHPNLNPVSKKQVVQALIPWLSRITNEVEAGEWINWLATRIQTDPENIKAAMGRTRGTRPTAPAKRNEEGPRPETPATPKPSEPRKRNLAETAVGILLSFPSLIPTVKDQLPSLRMAQQTPFLTAILPLLESADGTDLAWKDEEHHKKASLYVQELLAQYEEESVDEIWALQEFMAIASRIRSEAKEGAKTELAAKIRLAQQNGDMAELQRLMGELKGLI